MKRALSAVLLAAALGAIVATSRAPVETLEESVTGSFVISPSRPEVVIPWELALLEEGLDASESVSFRFEVDWEDVGQESSLEVTMIDARGESADTRSGMEQIVISCVRDCVGQGRVILHWPETVVRGQAQVQWDASALMWLYEEVSAQDVMTLTVGDPAG